MKTTRWRSPRFTLMLVGIMVCVAPLALGQEILNLPLTDDFVAPGDRVLSQELEVRDIAAPAVSPGAACVGQWPTLPGSAVGNDGICAMTALNDDTLRVTGFAGFAIPTNATILGIEVAVEGTGAVVGDRVDVRLLSGGQFAPVTLATTNFPVAACGDNAFSRAGGDDELWGRSWTPAQINAGLDVELIADLMPAGTAAVDRIEVSVYYAVPSTLNAVNVRNTVPLDDAVLGENIIRIEVVRVSDNRVIGSQSTTTNLNRFTTNEGVPIPISATYRAFTGTVELEIRVTLRDTVPLLKEFRLGDTSATIGVTEIDVTYVPPNGSAAALFIVGPAPGVAFDGLVLDSVIYPGQRFLAGRIEVDCSLVPFEVTIDRVLLENVGAATQLLGTNIDAIEIRRASDDALLGQASSTEIGKLTTDGTIVNATSNNEIPAYGLAWLEIWVTVDANAPTGQNLQFAADVRCNGTDFPAGIGPTFETGEPGGFEEVENLDLTGGRIFSGQRFLAQRLKLMDDDLDPYDVTINSFAVENVADATTRLAENQIAKIELVRARDGALMGEITNTSGLNAGGVRVLTPDANLASDDTEEVVEVWITLKTSVPHNRVIQLRTVVWHTENSRTFGFPHGIGPDSAEFETGPLVAEGFTNATTTTLPAREVFQGARFLAQELKLEDDDFDPYGITITSVMVRNMAPTSRLADSNVARLEVRRKSDGALMGEFIDPVGLSLAGVRVPTTESNEVLDDSIVELEIWITLKEAIPYGRKLQLESIVWHTEGTVTFQTDPLVGPAVFTTAEGDPPTNVDFTWEPADPSFEDEILFTPAADIADPEGAIANATFAWDFGDGSAIEQTTGTATVTHTYAGGGTFDVTLSVTGEDGLTSTKTHEVIVEGPPNEAPEIDEITAGPENPVIGDEVDFAATITDPDQPAGTAYGHAWEFGDEDDTTSDLAAPSFTYDEAGTYTVTLTVTDAQGATDTATFVVSVGNEPPVIGGLTATPTAPNTGDDVEFRATNVTDPDGDDIDHYEWNFGDSPTDVDGTDTIAHIYGTPGTYTVEVVAVDDRGGRSEARTLQITVSGPTRVVMRAYPNPAATTATINYFLPEGATDPELWIFDLNRNEILRQNLAAGDTEFRWDLRDETGDAVSNGLYFCMITAISATDRGITSDVFRLLVAR